jgi:hypothetical protein
MAELREGPARPLCEAVMGARRRLAQGQHTQVPTLEGAPALIAGPFLGGPR